MEMARKKIMKWDYKIVDEFWVGGKFYAPNTSNGYHGILRQWWEYYNRGRLCLLISENDGVKKVFELTYPDWAFQTLDWYEPESNVDFKYDLCGDKIKKIGFRYDLIICQATLEHVYAPFKAMENMVNLLAESGVLVLHTHDQSFSYHPYPRDYFRFFPDWFLNLRLFVKDLKLLELTAKRGHIFSAFRKEGT